MGSTRSLDPLDRVPDEVAQSLSGFRAHGILTAKLVEKGEGFLFEPSHL
mgnify:CR=1 FL=1